MRQKIEVKGGNPPAVFIDSLEYVLFTPTEIQERQMKAHINIMVDLETTGTRPGCAILSIAAVPFAVEYDLEHFYCKIDKASCAANGLHDDPATIAWWARQSEAARAEAFSGTTDIIVALTDFASYCQHLPEAPLVWGNGADFDNAVLAEAYKITGANGGVAPWKYSDSRCYRTLKNLFSQVPNITPPAVAHNALEDARSQAAHAQRIFQYVLSDIKRANSAT